jgi:methionyl-tRNA formyltransferase
MKTVFLTTEGNLAGREYLQSVLKSDCDLHAVIVETSEKAKEYKERTLKRMGGYYEPPSFAGLLAGKPIPVYYVKKHTNKSCLEAITKLKPEIIVSGGVSGILRNNILSIPTYFIGCHPGLLPKVRGSDVVAHAIVYNQPLGATCFVMDSGVDTGLIIHKEALSVFQGDTYEMIEAAMLPHCGRVLQKGLNMVVDGTASFVIQPDKHLEAYKSNKLIIQRAITTLKERSYKHYEV